MCFHRSSNQVDGAVTLFFLFSITELTEHMQYYKFKITFHREGSEEGHGVG